MTNTLETLSNDLAGLVESSSPFIVRVEARRRMPATGVIWSADGVIVTAQHVVTREEKIRVGLPDGDTVPAQFLGGDPSTDLAVLRAEASGLAAPAWTPATDLKVGQLVLALGRPGHTVQAALGVISALSQDGWRSPAGGEIDRYVQTDVVMYPGFSGGPLVGAAGSVIGLNTSALLHGISITVPGETVRRIAEAVLTHGRVRRGYLGVSAQAVRLPEALADQIGQETGLLLVGVEPDSPADRGGLLLGDVITALNGRPVRHMDDLQAGLSGDRVGQTVPVQVVRGGQVVTLDMVIGERD